MISKTKIIVYVLFFTPVKKFIGDLNSVRADTGWYPKNFKQIISDY